jgi:FolB domain-containing protein
LCRASPRFYPAAVDTITIKDLAVLCRIGVPEEERSQPQRLLITVQMNGDFSRACRSDSIGDTINYYDASRRVVEFCRTESFKLIEKLAEEIAAFILKDFAAQNVCVEVKKFILSDARYVSFKLERSLPV